MLIAKDQTCHVRSPLSQTVNCVNVIAMEIELTHSQILQTGEMVHFTRAELTSARPKSLHKHDFHELLWVQNGRVRHHLTDHSETLVEGDLRLIPPGPAHGLQGRGEHSLLVSLTLHPSVISDIVTRHPNCHENPTEITCWSLDSRALASLNQAALRLERGRRDALAAEAFLLPLLQDLLPAKRNQDMPDWLAKALAELENPEQFRNGASGLVDLTKRTHAHVSRSMRTFTGQTPSDYVNALRMRHAARLLVTDSESIPFIAAECGISNMAHFHKLFRAHHGLTPLKYRKAYQTDVVQPNA